MLHMICIVKELHSFFYIRTREFVLSLILFVIVYCSDQKDLLLFSRENSSLSVLMKLLLQKWQLKDLNVLEIFAYKSMMNLSNVPLVIF